MCELWCWSLSATIITTRVFLIETIVLVTMVITMMTNSLLIIITSLTIAIVNMALAKALAKNNTATCMLHFMTRVKMPMGAWQCYKFSLFAGGHHRQGFRCYGFRVAHADQHAARV